MSEHHNSALLPSPPISRAISLIALVSLMLVASACALVNMEFEACILVIGYLTTELATWPLA